jgi:hypothetical protein
MDFQLQRETENTTAEDVIDACISNLLRKSFNADINLLKQNVKFSHIEPYSYKGNENFLMDQFSKEETVRATVFYCIVFYVKSMLGIGETTFKLDNMYHTSNMIEFRVMVDLEDITRLIFHFEIIKHTDQITYFVCHFYSKLFTLSCGCFRF